MADCDPFNVSRNPDWNIEGSPVFRSGGRGYFSGEVPLVGLEHLDTCSCYGKGRLTIIDKRMERPPASISGCWTGAMSFVISAIVYPFHIP